MIHDFDVLVIGAGGAGLYAALEAGKSAKTAVLSTVYAVGSHTEAARGGYPDAGCCSWSNIRRGTEAGVRSWNLTAGDEIVVLRTYAETERTGKSSWEIDHVR